MRSSLWHLSLRVAAFLLLQLLCLSVSRASCRPIDPYDTAASSDDPYGSYEHQLGSLPSRFRGFNLDAPSPRASEGSSPPWSRTNSINSQASTGGSSSSYSRTSSINQASHNVGQATPHAAYLQDESDYEHPMEGRFEDVYAGLEGSLMHKNLEEASFNPNEQHWQPYRELATAFFGALQARAQQFDISVGSLPAFLEKYDESKTVDMLFAVNDDIVRMINAYNKVIKRLKKKLNPGNPDVRRALEVTLKEEQEFLRRVQSLTFPFFGFLQQHAYWSLKLRSPLDTRAEHLSTAFDNTRKVQFWLQKGQEPNERQVKPSSVWRIEDLYHLKDAFPHWKHVW